MRSILVLVDRFSKYVIFMVVPSTCTTTITVELFFRNVVKLFGLSKDIISD